MRWRGSGKKRHVKSVTVYRLDYWSTRKEGDIDEPHGHLVANDKETVISTAHNMLKHRDTYRMEIWKRVSLVERAPVIEECQGNPAHMVLDGARRDKPDELQGENTNG